MHIQYYLTHRLDWKYVENVQITHQKPSSPPPKKNLLKQGVLWLPVDQIVTYIEKAHD